MKYLYKMNLTYLRNIIKEQIDDVKDELKQRELDTSLFTPQEEQCLGKFAELGSTSMGIIYAPNEIGIREFLGRSGKDFNLTPDVLYSLIKKGILKIVPYGGYSRNEDYTLQLQISLEDVEQYAEAAAETGGGGSAEPAGGAVGPDGEELGPDGEETPEVPAGPPEESARSSKDLSKLLVSEAKKSKKKSKSKVHTRKARTLGRLPKGYVVYLERIIEIMGQKLHTSLEKEHMVADILDNLAHNFGLTPQQIYKSFIFYRSQNRLQNIIKK